MNLWIPCWNCCKQFHEPFKRRAVAIRYNSPQWKATLLRKNEVLYSALTARLANERDGWSTTPCSRQISGSILTIHTLFNEICGGQKEETSPPVNLDRRILVIISISTPGNRSCIKETSFGQLVLNYHTSRGYEFVDDSLVGLDAQ